ncbi:DUF3870 domain-containing protein [Priestia flexa]|jgi:Domain of unknown function (DUF3870)|uniref:DUF3870 domain-containing protein n=2 Tax=Priestia TaxID=2800373 RepID=A0ABD7X3C2_PRIAR|nr:MULTISPECIES: DUF3870 domain-containing protein [Priestia]MBN8251556.1 DUF3870 domain-containing protein [Priestia flexa]MBN8434180.1 DUF3870 domain-containing protein [Priestia flexa]MBU3568744.1 DUF3870 domain-containing protein [Priestia aryabhattai]MBY6085887.1 DUF3870 domain-containing protein [Priestia flexa]MCA0967036.1 DUF3870 domain-containing protein [Priestia flexa]
MGMSTLLITAYAKAPQNTSMYENNKYAGIVLEIHKESHIIINAEFTFLTKLAQDFFKRMIVGYDFSKDINPLIEEITTVFLAPSQQAVIVALKIAHQRYEDSLREINKK